MSDDTRILIDGFTVETHKHVYVEETPSGYKIEVEGTRVLVLEQRVWRNGTRQWKTSGGVIFYRAPWTNEHKPDDEKQPSTLDGEGIGFAVQPLSPRQKKVLTNVIAGESSHYPGVVRPQREEGYGLFQINNWVPAGTLKYNPFANAWLARKLTP